MAKRDDEVRRAVEEEQKQKRIRAAQKKGENASGHRRKIIGENIGRIVRGES